MREPEHQHFVIGGCIAWVGIASYHLHFNLVFKTFFTFISCTVVF